MSVSMAVTAVGPLGEEVTQGFVGRAYYFKIIIPCAAVVVPDCEAPLRVRGCFQLVNEGESKILERDLASFRTGEERIVADAKFPGALARNEYHGGGDEGPVELLFFAQQVEEGHAGLSFRSYLLWNALSVNQFHTGGDLKASDSSHDHT
ncbi:MAG: hypothetical protein ACP5HZ_10125 [Ferrimicrobium sp.]